MRVLEFLRNLITYSEWSEKMVNAFFQKNEMDNITNFLAVERTLS